MIHSTQDYYRRLESQANQLIALRQEALLLAMISEEDEALAREGVSFTQIFPALKEWGFYIENRNSFSGHLFQPSRNRILHKPQFALEITYPLYLGEVFIGNAYFYLKEESFHQSMLISALFLLIIFIAFAVGLTLSFKNFNLEKLVQEQALEMNRHLSYIVHELKNPLTAINNLAYILKKYAGEKNVVDIGRRIGTIAVDLEEKINYLLNLARIDFQLMKQQSRMIQLRPVVEDYLDKISDLILEKKLSLNNGVDTEISIYASPQILEIILSNLLSNAIKYTPEGEVTVKTLEGRNETRLIIEDTGIGIPAADQERVFEMFYRTPESKKVEKGTGIGLYLTRKLIHEMGWKIKVESPTLPHGRGSRISILIPSKAEESL